mgnify:CR=1 FL=1
MKGGKRRKKNFFKLNFFFSSLLCRVCVKNFPIYYYYYYNLQSRRVSHKFVEVFFFLNRFRVSFRISEKKMFRNKTREFVSSRCSSHHGRIPSLPVTSGLFLHSNSCIFTSLTCVDSLCLVVTGFEMFFLIQLFVSSFHFESKTRIVCPREKVDIVQYPANLLSLLLLFLLYILFMFELN